MKRHMLATCLVVGLGLMLSSCGDDPGEPTGQTTLDLSGRTFLGDSVTVDGQPHALVPGSTLRLGFQDDQVAASAGCNSMGGAATWSDGVLRVDDGGLVSTEMGCERPLMKQDAWYLTLLTDEPTLVQDGDTLTLTHDTTVVTLTDEEVVTPDVSLTGTRWVLDTIATGDVVGTTPRGVHAAVTFAPDGSLTTDLGCNTGGGTYSVTGSTLDIGQIGHTERACPPPASDVEEAMLTVLQGSVEFRIDGDSLTVTRPHSLDGAPSALTFRAG